MKIKAISERQFRDVPDAMMPATLLQAESSKWEYKSILLPRASDLNQFGKQGWELVSTTAQAGELTMFYFRRQVS